MNSKRLILKKEAFGGIFFDSDTRKRSFLKPDEYASKKEELSHLESRTAKVQIIDVTKRGYPLLSKSTSSPNSIFWELTKHCNGACTDCFMDSNAPKWTQSEVTLSEIQEIIEQFVDLGGYSIRLTGGEPTTRHDFFEIVDLLNDYGLEIGLNTNGMFDEKTLEEILSRGIKDIRISLDGPEAVNDKIRWAGNYQGALKTIETIAEYNRSSEKPTEPTINVVLMKSTLPYVEHMARLAARYGFKVSFGLMRLGGRANVEEMLSPKEVVQAAYAAQSVREGMRLPKGAIRINYDIFCDDTQEDKNESTCTNSPFPFDNSKCLLGTDGLSIDAYARITPCGYLGDAEELLGEDLRGKDILSVWHNSPLLEMLRNITRDGCSDCHYYKRQCNGGCPAMAYFAHGDIQSDDPYCVRDIATTGITTKKI